jgi:hypothetical protein
MPQNLEDHLWKPSQASLWTISRCLLVKETRYLICPQHRKVNNQLASLHGTITQLHCNCKILESSLKPASAIHPDQLFLFSSNLQGGIELLNHCLIPVLLELEDSSTHDTKKINQAAHMRERFQLRPT